MRYKFPEIKLFYHHEDFLNYEGLILFLFLSGMPANARAINNLSTIFC